MKKMFIAVALTLTSLFVVSINSSATQKPSKLDIEQWRDVLRNVKKQLEESYYDPSFHGMDIDARFKLADEKLKTAESLGQLVGIVAQVLLDLNDSHTFFIPPFNASNIEYGWRMQAVGNDCYVAAVRPGSDAFVKGLQVGDKVLSIDGRPLDRTKVWLANYLFYTLRPESEMRLMIEKPDKRQQQLVINSKVREGSTITTYAEEHQWELDVIEEFRLTRHRYQELSEDVLIWKMPQFDLTEDGLANAFGKFKNRKALILDLRGNSGGSLIDYFSGYFFPSNIKIADRRGRKELEPMVAKSQKDKAFKGKLVVLIDAGSASAAEMFARIVQLEKRGVVIGDRSSGSVRQAGFHRLQVGVKRAIGFAISAAEADIIMPDGKSLEHVGVIPDELVLPTAEDMSTNRDPVLAFAAALVGINLDSKKAGELFPVEWKSR